MFMCEIPKPSWRERLYILFKNRLSMLWYYIAVPYSQNNYYPENLFFGHRNLKLKGQKNSEMINMVLYHYN